MIAAWMLYCVLIALGLALAALVAERALIAGRVPVRYVWTVAVVLSVWIPAVAYRFARPAPAPSVQAIAPPELAAAAFADSAIALPQSAAPVVHAATRWDWRAAVARTNEPLAVAWLALSGFVALYVFAGVVALAWMRRRWRRETVQSVDVLISETIGPALVGAVAPAIVLPEWSLAMEPSQVALMLRHEQEHQRVGDGRLLAAAQLALVAMPWNVAIWWQLLRLRLAVELDCDARVLRDVDARSYGDLLLEVARPRRRPMLIGVTAFAERAAQLERRIRFVARRRDRAMRGARTTAALTAMCALSIAWVAPHPATPPRTAPNAPTPTRASAAVRDSIPTMDSRETSSTTLDTSVSMRMAPRLDSTRDATIRSLDSLVSGLRSIPATPSRVPTVGTPIVAAATVQQGDSLFDRLFAGIVLTQEQAARAHQLIANLEKSQKDRMVASLQLILTNLRQALALQAHRDSLLMSLLTSDADRALLQSRTTQRPNWATSGGTPTVRFDTLVTSAAVTSESLAAVGSGGGRGRGGGRGGGGRATVFIGDSVPPGGLRLGGPGGGRMGRGMSIEDAAAATYHSLLDGINLTAAQQSQAMAIITDTEQQLREATVVQPIGVRIRPMGNRVQVDSASAAALLGVVTSDADRATLASRLFIMARPLEVRAPPR